MYTDMRACSACSSTRRLLAGPKDSAYSCLTNSLRTDGGGHAHAAENPGISKARRAIGSGPIVIGQAAEFDYAGTQACRALKEEGLEVVLVNSNPGHHHDRRAPWPMQCTLNRCTLETVKRIIQKEKPGRPAFHAWAGRPA